MSPKRVIFIRGSRQSIRDFPHEARQLAGAELWQVQIGKYPSDWKPLPTVGPGTMEIRIHAPNEFRVIYIAKFFEAVYVLHAFEKKTPKTTTRDLRLARAAYAEIQRQRHR